MQGPEAKGMSLCNLPGCVDLGGGGGDAQSSSTKSHPPTHRACGGAGTRSEASLPPGVLRGSASHLAGSSSQPQLQDWVTAEASVWVDDGPFCKRSWPGANNAAEQIDGWCCLFWEEENYFS